MAQLKSLFEQVTQFETFRSNGYGSADVDRGLSANTYSAKSLEGFLRWMKEMEKMELIADKLEKVKLPFPSSTLEWRKEKFIETVRASKQSGDEHLQSTIVDRIFDDYEQGKVLIRKDDEYVSEGIAATLRTTLLDLFHSGKKMENFKDVVKVIMLTHSSEFGDHCRYENDDVAKCYAILDEALENQDESTSQKYDGYGDIRVRILRELSEVYRERAQLALDRWKQIKQEKDGNNSDEASFIKLCLTPEGRMALGMDDLMNRYIPEYMEKKGLTGDINEYMSYKYILDDMDRELAQAEANTDDPAYIEYLRGPKEFEKLKEAGRAYLEKIYGKGKTFDQMLASKQRLLSYEFLHRSIKDMDEATQTAVEKKEKEIDDLEIEKQYSYEALKKEYTKSVLKIWDVGKNGCNKIVKELLQMQQEMMENDNYENLFSKRGWEAAKRILVILREIVAKSEKCDEADFSNYVKKEFEKRFGYVFDDFIKDKKEVEPTIEWTLEWLFEPEGEEETHREHLKDAEEMKFEDFKEKYKEFYNFDEDETTIDATREYIRAKLDLTIELKKRFARAKELLAELQEEMPKLNPYMEEFLKVKSKKVEADAARKKLEKERTDKRRKQHEEWKENVLECFETVYADRPHLPTAKEYNRMMKEAGDDYSKLRHEVSNIYFGLSDYEDILTSNVLEVEVDYNGNITKKVNIYDRAKYCEKKLLNSISEFMEAYEKLVPEEKTEVEEKQYQNVKNLKDLVTDHKFMLVEFGKWYRNPYSQEKPKKS